MRTGLRMTIRLLRLHVNIITIYLLVRLVELMKGIFINSEQNQMLQDMPTMDELKQVIFAMNPNSAPSRDCIGGKFNQACWNIIKNDLLAAV